MNHGLAALAAQLEREGGLVAGALRPAGDGAADLVTEAVREGYLLHHAESRIVVTGDPDLALLAGDRCYAIGLEHLAAEGDLEAIALLAGVIAAGARAHAEGRPEAAEARWREVLAARSDATHRPGKTDSLPDG